MTNILTKLEEAEDDAPRRYMCERCGGKGIQEEGRYWAGEAYRFEPRKTCPDCNGEGCLGLRRSNND